MIKLNLPRGAIVRGALYDTTDDRSWLTQDVLEIEFPNGVFIDVGWYPEHDLDGKFRIRVFLESWENQLIDPPICSSDPNEVREFIEQLAEQFKGNLISESLSSDLVIANCLV